MRDYPVAPLLIGQSPNGMERASGFESSNLLIVLAFEEEIDLWSCGILALPFGILQVFCRLWCRGEAVECCRC